MSQKSFENGSKKNKDLVSEESDIGNIKEDFYNLTTYINKDLGFSIRIPKDVETVYRCNQEINDNQTNRTPIGVFEDSKNRIVYISQNYYYDRDYDQIKNEYIGDCHRIDYTLDKLKKEAGNHPFLGWTLFIDDIKEAGDIDKYIKIHFGPEILVHCYNEYGDGLVDITIKDGNNIESHESYRVIYSLKKHKMLSVYLGGECTFNNVNPGKAENQSILKCYSDEMIDSFKFE